ncbi:MAG: TolC family protein [Planctomycetota bacterium]
MSVADLAPDATRVIQNQPERGGHHWTTGGSAVPRPCAPTIEEVLPTQSASAIGTLASFRSIDTAGSPVSPNETNELDSELVEVLGSTSTTARELRVPLTLEDAARMALSNNQIVRRDADFITTPSRVIAAPDQVTTTLSPSIVSSGFLFGQRGEAAALSDFDSQLNFRTAWGRNEAIQNNLFLSGGILPGGALVEDTAESVVEIARDTRSGGRSRLFHTISYNASNRQDLLFPSAYRLAVGAEFRQPFLAGAGRLYTDVAGPPGDLLRGITGVSQGILISRNQTRVSQLELHVEVAALLTDVETVYWDLRAATEAVACVQAALVEFAEYERILDARAEAEADTSELERLTLLDLKLDLQQTLSEQEQGVRSAAARLNRLLGMPPETNDLILPLDDFLAAELIVDDESVKINAAAQRAEIRQQRYRIASIDLQIRAAQSLLLPQLDGIARYQVNGFGDSLARETVPGPDQSIQSAYGNLSQGDFTGWELGFQFSHRFGRRLERTRIRNLRLEAQKERIILHEQQDEIRREIETLLDQIDQTIVQRNLLRKRLDTLSRRRSVLQERYNANDPQATIQQLASADLSMVPVRLKLFSNQAQYSQLIARLQAASGSSLRENGIIIQNELPFSSVESEVSVPE